MRSFCCLMFIACLFVSCQLSKETEQKKSQRQISYLQKTDTIVEEDFLNLKSYSLTASYQCDSLNLLYGYNRRASALDCINLNTHKTTLVPLAKEGPNAIMGRPGAIFVHTPDSIWISDSAQRIVLVDSTGRLLNSFTPNQLLKEKEELLLGSNYAISIARLFYDKEKQTLLYGVKDYSNGKKKFKVREFSVQQGVILTEYPLKQSEQVADLGTGKYGNMEEPNVTFSETYVLYNYPVESNIYLIDRKTGEYKCVEAPSAYVKNVASPCISPKDYATWERHEVENTHFHDVVYLPSVKVYARLHISDGVFDVSKSLGDMLAARTLYLTLMDKDFLLIKERKLPMNRYNYFTGWCPLQDGILLFVDNSSSKAPQIENLVFDVLQIKDN